MENLNHLMVFFAKNGLTSSEANHQANMTKEVCEKIARDLESTSSAKEILIYDNNVDIDLDSNHRIDNLEDICKKEGELYAISAWLREAIKAKEILLKYFNDLHWSLFLDSETESVSYFTVEQPIEPNYDPIFVTEQDIIGEMSIADRAEYLRCESIAAHLGKKLHSRGLITIIRKQIQKFIPTRFHSLNNGNGVKDFPVLRKKLYEIDEFEKIFFSLQEEHRSAEQKLNWFKANIKNEVTLRNAAITAKEKEKYQDEIDQYNIAIRNWNDEKSKHDQKITILKSSAEERRLRKIKEISELKIIIPEKLQTVLEFVKNYK